MRAAPLLATVQGIITLVLLAACAQESKHTNHFAKSPTAVVVSLGEGAARKVRLEILAPKIIHVTAFPSESTDLQSSLMALGHADGTVPFNVRWISPGTRDAAKFSATPDQTAEYSGAELTIHRRGAS